MYCSAASHRAICGLRCCISAWPGSSWCGRVLDSWTVPWTGIVEHANRAPGTEPRVVKILLLLRIFTSYFAYTAAVLHVFSDAAA